MTDRLGRKTWKLSRTQNHMIVVTCDRYELERLLARVEEERRDPSDPIALCQFMVQGRETVTLEAPPHIKFHRLKD